MFCNKQIKTPQETREGEEEKAILEGSNMNEKKRKTGKKRGKKRKENSLHPLRDTSMVSSKLNRPCQSLLTDGSAVAGCWCSLASFSSGLASSASSPVLTLFL